MKQLAQARIGLHVIQQQGGYNASSWPSETIMGGQGEYWIYNNVSAWTGIVGNDGIIRFSNNVTFVEMGYSAGATLYLEAYNSADNLLDQDSGPANLRFANSNETGPGTLRVDAPTGELISYVTIHDTGNLWTIDNLTTDATVTEPWSFVQISDTHIGYTEMECIPIGGLPYCWQVAARTRLVAVLNKVLKEERPLFIVNTGDITDRGCNWLVFCGTDNADYRSYSEAMRLVTDSNIRVYNIPGNHDQRTGIGYLDFCLAFPSCFADPTANSLNQFILNHETFYSEDNSILFVALDTGNGHCSGTLTEDDISFLEGLDQSIPKIILTHHPAVADDNEIELIQKLWGYVVSDCRHAHVLDGQDHFLNYCEDPSNNVKLVFSGHTHTNHVYNKNLGTLEETEYPKYVITGSAGKSDYPVYRRISVSSPPVVEEVTQLTDEDFNYISAQLYSPASLHVYDSSGEHTGYDPAGGSERGIPRSVYFSHYVFETEEGPEVSPEEVLIWDPSDQYLYQVIGSQESTYRLKLTSITVGEGLSFYGVGILTSPGAKHVYAVDWDAISAGEEGVVVEIDADGDGIFESTVIADKDLTSEEFALQTDTIIDFEPDVVNLRSPGKVVTVYIELPEGFEVSNIDVSGLKLNDLVPALSKPFKIDDYDEDGIADLMVKFDRQQVREALGSGTQMVTLTGRLSDGRPIAGIDFIRVIGGTETETVKPDFESIETEEFIVDMEENLQLTENNAADTGGENAFDIKEGVAFMLFEASEIINDFGPDSFNNEESAFQLTCAIDDVFTMLDEGTYFESLILLENDILQRMDGCANVGQPDEDDWITSNEGQILLYPRVVETIELLESLL